jgi:hypothetical protein
MLSRDAHEITQRGTDLAHARNNVRPQRQAFRPRLRYNLQSRVGLVMGREMDYAGLGDVETLLTEDGVALAPMECEGARRGDVVVLPTAGLKDVQDHAVNGLVVPGGLAGEGPAATAGLGKLFQAARAAHLPVMAFGDAVAPALAAFGLEARAEAAPAVLILDGVRVLETAADVREAAAAFRKEAKAAA